VQRTEYEDSPVGRFFEGFEELVLSIGIQRPGVVNQHDSEAIAGLSIRELALDLSDLSHCDALALRLGLFEEKVDMSARLCLST
jgi:hypothetical protein